MDPGKYSALVQYIQTGEPPEGLSASQIYYLIKHAKEYHVDGDYLYRKNGTNTVRVLKPDSIEKVIAMFHYHPMGGHYAYQNTLEKIKNTYFWETMNADIRKFVEECPRCQLKKKPKQESLKPIAIKPEPFAMVGMDIKHVGTSRGGHRYIIVAIDYFSKWVEARPLIHANSIEIYNFLYEEVICRHGTPEKLITDNGSNISGELISIVCKEFGIKHQTTSPYHPQGNGLVERFNRTLGQGLRSMLDDKERHDWHLYLPALLFAYRTIRQASTKQTPFSVIYGRNARTPFDNLLDNFVTEAEDVDPAILEQAFRDQWKCMANIRDKAKHAIEVTQQNRIKSFNKRFLHANQDKPPFEQGDTVMLFISALAASKQAKVQDYYEGPYVVTDVYAKGYYKITDPINVSPNNKIVHGSRLIIYKAPNVSFNNGIFKPQFNGINSSISSPSFSSPSSSNPSRDSSSSSTGPSPISPSSSSHPRQSNLSSSDSRLSRQPVASVRTPSTGRDVWRILSHHDFQRASCLLQHDPKETQQVGQEVDDYGWDLCQGLPESY